MARRATDRTSAPPREETLDIFAVGAKGDGLARCGSGDVFVPYTLPGERVRAHLVGDRGEVLDILEPSAGRIEPPCAHFGNCGGCALQHWRADDYLAWKREMVATALARHGVEGFRLAPIILTPLSARRRATLAWKREGARLGFKARGTHDIVDIAGCLVLSKELVAVASRFAALVAHFPSAWKSAALALTACENGIDLDIAPMSKGGDIEGPALQAFGAAMAEARILRASRNGAALLQHDAPIVRFAGVAVTPPPGGFLQASLEGERALTTLVVAAAGGARRAIDLFSGCGSFSFPLAKIASVEAFDGDAASVAALDAAARRSILKPVKARRRDLFDRPLAAAELDGADCVVFDPPRAGAEAQARMLAKSKVKTVVAVSCNPATLARDARTLIDGGYTMGTVTPIDQFHYTPHTECVAVFKR